jgi:hypothetical protein
MMKKQTRMVERGSAFYLQLTQPSQCEIDT